jgi:hypothetical protein
MKSTQKKKSSPAAAPTSHATELFNAGRKIIESEATQLAKIEKDTLQMRANLEKEIPSLGFCELLRLTDAFKAVIAEPTVNPVEYFVQLILEAYGNDNLTPDEAQKIVGSFARDFVAMRKAAAEFLDKYEHLVPVAPAQDTAA